MKAMARPYVTLFGMALIVAVVARIGLGIMDATGALAYDYISASDVAILDTICPILTGSAFVAFMFAAASLALTLSVAGVALYAAIARREGARPARQARFCGDGLRRSSQSYAWLLLEAAFCRPCRLAL